MIKKKLKVKVIILIIVMLTIVLFNVSLYIFDKKVMPRILIIGHAEMKSKAIYIINDNINKIYKEKFNYDDIVKIDKDNAGNIVMVRADTLMMNSLATEVSLNAQRDLREIGDVGIKVPFGYVLNNNILANIGPEVSVKMQPVGDIEVSYSSQFESAGINQTRHKIYLNVKTRIKVNVPLKSDDFEIKHEIPICETIIVGKIPSTNLQMENEKK